MNQEDLKQRTKRLGLRIIKLVEALPQKPTAKAIGNQLLRSGTSVGANYRSACRARSKADFISKIGIVTASSKTAQRNLRKPNQQSAINNQQ